MYGGDYHIEREYLHHFCSYCGKVIEDDVFVNFVANVKYHYHYKCYKLEIEMLKKGGDPI